MSQANIDRCVDEDRSWRAGSTGRQPIAEVTPGEAGRSTVAIDLPQLRAASAATHGR